MKRPKRPKNRIQNDKSDGLIWIDEEVVEVLEFELNGGNTDELQGGFEGKTPSKSDKNRAFKTFVHTVFHEGVHYGLFKQPDGQGNKAEHNATGGDKGFEFQDKAYKERAPRTTKSSLNNGNNL
ncbi:MAG: hypothetical protein IPN26_04705 [Bacteroidetes bacterium]|nr:hypothetical protein [Bacteroidota bacterium]